MKVLFTLVALLFPLQLTFGSPQRFQETFTALLKQEQLSPVFLFDDLGGPQITEDQDFTAYKKTWDAHTWRLAEPPVDSLSPPPRSKHRITFLIFPGIIGEFIPQKPFDDVALRYRDVHSPLVDAWKKLDPKAFPCPHTSLSLSGENDSLAEDKTPLRKLFTIFALPETELTPGADVIVLKAPLFSLETLGDMKHLGPRYLQRVNTLWSALHYKPEHLVLVGYSLGVVPALDFVYASHVQEDSVKPQTLISLSGLLFGSAVADLALGYSLQTSSLYKEWINDLWMLHEALRPLDRQQSFQERLFTLHHNQTAWLRFIAHFTRDSLQHSRELEPLRSFGRMLLTETDQGKVLQGLGFTSALLTENGKLVRAYNRNIRRWRLFLEQARSALDQLSTKGRQQWFQEHGPLPDTLRLISVSAIMPSEVLMDQSQSPELKAFDERMLDFHFIRENLRLHQTLTEIRQMDGWVGLGESRYDPLVSCRWALAWCSAEFPHEWWGVLNSDHWGLAIAKALPQREELEHPFPRALFLRAAASVLSSEDTALGNATP